MLKLLIALSLAIMATVTACGGGDGSRMTVEEYAAACEATGDDLNSMASFDEDASSSLKAVEDALAEVRRWNPPEELQEFHAATIRAGEGAINAIKETGFIDLMQEFEKAEAEEDTARLLELMEQMAEVEDAIVRFDDEISALEDEVTRAVENLSPDTREILAAANCV